MINKRAKVITLLVICLSLFIGMMPIHSYAANGIKTTDTIEKGLNISIDLSNCKQECEILKEMDGFVTYDEKSNYAIFDIRMPKTFVVSKDDAKKIGEAYFMDQINYLGELYGILPDIDDIEFQSIAKGYALSDDNYIQLAKFIDIYENYDYNDKMKELTKKIEENNFNSIEELLSDENFFTLLSMMPIDTDVYPATKEGTIKSDSKGVMSLSGYSGSDAKKYAQTWAYKTNNTSYGYYAVFKDHPSPNNNDMWSGGTGNNQRTWDDCANFVSQCLKAGGASTVKNGLFPYSNNNNWYYSDSKPSNTWGGASNFQQHWTARVGVRSSSADAKVGDPVSLDYHGDNIADHTIIITSINGSSSSQILYACHTSDQFEERGKSLATLYNSYKNVWIYAVG